MKRLTALSIVTLFFVAALAAPVAAQTAWPMYGGDPGNTRYSALERITPANVGRLKVAWALQLGSLRSQLQAVLDACT